MPVTDAVGKNSSDQRATRYGHSLSPERREWLTQQLALRGWRKKDLAEFSRTSTTTISLLFAGKAVEPGVLERVAAALTEHPAKPGMEQLLGVSSDPRS